MGERYAELRVNGILRATTSERPADPEDAPGQMFRDYRTFDKDGEYVQQNNCSHFTFDEMLIVLRWMYWHEGTITVKETKEYEWPQ